MRCCWHMLLGLLLLTAASAFAWKQGCPETDLCGNVSIPYPFSIKEGCSREGFKLHCNETDNNQQKLFWKGYEILEITLEGQANVLAFVASDCYNESGRAERYDSEMPLGKDGPFTFSDTRNKFTAIGCDTIAYITSYSGRNFTSGNFTSGCVSVCWEKESVIDGNCSGIGCCQTSIPQGATSFLIQLSSFYNHTSVLDFNPCSFAFLIADDDQFKFNIEDLSAGSQYNSYPGYDKQVPLVLDWAIGNETCERAKENITSYACKSLNSICNESTNGPGYRCNCSEGYEGNPYLEEGCKDIDECERDPYPCGAGKCKNKPGGYSCTPKIQLIVVILGTVSSLLFVFIVGSWLYWGLKKRKLLQLKEKFFRQNGGLLLQQLATNHFT